MWSKILIELFKFLEIVFGKPHRNKKKLVFVLTPGIDLSPCESPDIPLTILDTTALHQSRQDDDDDEGDVLNNSLTPMDWLPR